MSSERAVDGCPKSEEIEGNRIGGSSVKWKNCAK